MSPVLALARTVADTAADEPLPLDLTMPDSQVLVHHPDGYYWLGAEGRLQIGPYASAEEALADLHRAEDEGLEPDETLPEAERVLGLSDWLDPDTGALAEDTHLRLEDH
ncbi:MAG: SPOR domain-containing protein [Rubrivivax sp.]|nr:SPOR domain-containing protein [Rubrivivax sp.]